MVKKASALVSDNTVSIVPVREQSCKAPASLTNIRHE